MMRETDTTGKNKKKGDNYSPDVRSLKRPRTEILPVCEPTIEPSPGTIMTQ